MSPSTAGIAFDEMMAGSFALGETDPAAGAAKGARDSTTLTVHATVTIHDIDRFIADPAHTGAITGTVEFPPLGAAMSAPSGVFNLFSPTHDPTLRLMIYELGFSHYYFAGKKEVRLGPVTDLWHATTTLYTQLHDGPDTTAPVIGAGILHLNVEELSRLAANLRAIDTNDPIERVGAVARFGQFFLGELWHAYRHL